MNKVWGGKLLHPAMNILSLFNSGGLVLCLYPENLLAKDAMTPERYEQTFKASPWLKMPPAKKEVDAILNKLSMQGYSCKKLPKMFFGEAIAGILATPMVICGSFLESALDTKQ